MAESLFPFAYLRDARLAGHATSAVPAWLWQPDGYRVLWMNPAAANLLGIESAAGAAERSFAPGDPIADRMARLAETLPANGSPRLAALDLPTPSPGQRLMCLCSRLTLDDMTPGILAVATESGGATLSFAERVRRLVGDADAPVAIFAPDGTLVHATAAAAERLDGSATLASLGAQTLAAEALANGHAEGATPQGTLRLDRLGRDATLTLLARFLSEPPTPDAATPAQPELSPPPDIDLTPAPSGPVPDVEPVQETEDEAAPVAITADRAPSTAPDRAVERRSPLRFVWQMDPDGRFTIASEEFAALIGPHATSLLGQRWIDIAQALNLDPDEHISRAVDSRETWSGVTISWPVEGSDERLMVEMSGLPMFDRERLFLGYRGFGVCRDAERLTARAHGDDREAEPETFAPPRAGESAEPKAPTLSPVERTAFRELARQLSARLKGDHPDQETARADDEAGDRVPAVSPIPEADDAPAPPAPSPDGARDLMDRLPVGVLVYRINTPVYANRAFLKWSGDASLGAFVTSGGLDRLFLESDVTETRDNDARRLTLTSGSSSGLAECRLFSIVWEGERAHAIAIVPLVLDQQMADTEQRQTRDRINQLRSIIDLATDGVVFFDGDGAIIRLNRGAEALFGVPSNTVEGQSFTVLLAAENRPAASADFAELARDPEARHAGREVANHAEATGGRALFMTLGHIAGEPPRYCAVFRDIGQWKRTEADLISAKRQAEQASQAKSDFLAKISHEIRTPLNAIIGFSEVMMEERLGTIENERYRAYLKDIHTSGEHLVALLNDLLDLSKIEAGKLELRFDNVNLNELTQQCVALMQPQANRGRIIIRTSLAPGLPPIVADARSVRQILLNLLSNSIKFTDAGGQVIVSTTLTERNDAVLRVRDTGIGMSEAEIETALEPFRQIETSARGGSGGTGLGLPLTKALAEANRAIFAIKSSIKSGTLVEVAFPTTRPPER